jgi:hypothetical protein
MSVKIIMQKSKTIYSSTTRHIHKILNAASHKVPIVALIDQIK